jgi:hypothetical protein
MPRGRKTDFLGSIQAQAAKVLHQLESRIERLRSEIAEMTAQADSWRRAFGGTGRRRGRPPGRSSGGGKRVDWNEVLASVPKRFGVEDVMKHPGAAAKGRAQVYPALSRWELAKLVRRVDKGVYEKVDGAAEPSQPRTKRRSARKHAAAKRKPRAAKTAKKKGAEAQAG